MNDHKNICIYLQGKPIVFCFVHKICRTIGLLRITINKLCSDEQFLPLKKVAAPHLNKQESPSSSDAFIVPSLKLAQWSRRRFLNVVNIFLLFFPLGLESSQSFVQTWISLIKFIWNWPCGSWEEVKNATGCWIDRWKTTGDH